MTDLVLPGWVLPPIDRVTAVRNRAAADVVAGAVDGVVTGLSTTELGIMCAIDWVGGRLPAAPLTVLLDAPLPHRVVVERLLAFEMVSGRAVPDSAYERYGYEPLYPGDMVLHVDYAGGVLEGLGWLLGKTQHEPGIRYVYRPPAAG